MALRIEEISARIEIMDVLYRYCRGVDRGDAALIASVYHDGAIDEHGAWVGQGKDFGGYLVPAMDEAELIGQHHITNAIIEVSGDTAQVESYFLAFHPEKREGGPGHVMVAGRYLDRFELRTGKWAIAHRTVLVDLARSLVSDPEWAGLAHFPRGERREEDLSAQKLRGFCAA